jgi:hypothetical protein
LILWGIGAWDCCEINDIFAKKTQQIDNNITTLGQTTCQAILGNSNIPRCKSMSVLPIKKTKQFFEKYVHQRKRYFLE